MSRLFSRCLKKTETQEGWESDDWAHLLAPLLTDEAQRAYFTLPTEVSSKYSELKKEILARLGLSSVCAAQYFHNWESPVSQPESKPPNYLF